MALNIVLTELTTSITGLRVNPRAVIEEGAGRDIAILNHNQVIGYIVPPDTYNKMLRALAASKY